MYPGPTIEVNVGDRVIVNVTNNLPNSSCVLPDPEKRAPELTPLDDSAIHWHGLYQRGTPFYDGTNAISQVISEFIAGM